MVVIGHAELVIFLDVTKQRSNLKLKVLFCDALKLFNKLNFIET